ncbi:MAG: hypothetical protein EZS28_032605 [Streblomastix strix]|uniref:Uncharacterized protein n=1 Tax=Streblomastix strix TaxID=222440 RepID=A0A5J4UN10_9EUKA|nr:MAG: hypothetical protein EZS28_032605 [Streblomastix strix]
MDIWRDGIGFRALETELPDMSNVMTILGTATEGVNAITDLSFSGNTLVPAKNSTFVRDDDSLLLQKVDKAQLIDAHTKGEADNLLNNKDDSGVSYTKGEDDALLLLKADKAQLINVYTNGEADNLFNNKADQSTTYTKIETDQFVTKIDVGDIDLTDYYTKTKTDELLDEKAATTELSNYVSLGTAQIINTNRTYNNSCRFVSSIDGMSTVTGASFVKSGADNTVVLLGAGGIKPLSEFSKHYPKPLEQQPLPMPIEEQTLQTQVKNNDDIIYGSGDGSNEEFIPTVLNAIMKLDLSSQLERQSFQASSGSDLQLIVYCDRITLTASCATTGLFPSGDQLGGYLFQSYPLDARPKFGDQVIELIRTDVPNTYVIFLRIIKENKS